MKKTVARPIKYIFVFFVTVAILAESLIAVALIPQNQIKPKVEESADFFCKHEMQALMVDSIMSSENDYFADCILLNIAYNLDRKQHASIFELGKRLYH